MPNKSAIHGATGLFLFGMAWTCFIMFHIFHTLLTVDFNLLVNRAMADMQAFLVLVGALFANITCIVVALKLLPSTKKP